MLSLLSKMTATTNPHCTWGQINKKMADMPADDLMAQVAHKKPIQVDKKKKYQGEKEAEEACLKAKKKTMSPTPSAQQSPLLLTWRPTIQTTTPAWKTQT
jgi:hypothetical protein